MLLGLTAALTFGWLGVSELRSRSDRGALLEAEALVTALVARLRSVPADQRSVVLERAARRAGVELLLVEADGRVVIDASLRAPPAELIRNVLVTGRGTTTTQLGRVRYAALSLGSLRDATSLAVFVPAPDPPPAMAPLVTSLGLLATLLVGMAVLVAWALARDVHADVDFVTSRIAAMAAQEAEPSGKPIPIRAVDSVGELTGAFNELVSRFAAAERRYRENLARALAYDRDRSAFLAALSHELRTPLNAILGFTEVLLSEVDGPLSPDARESLEVVRTSGLHLAALIDDVLDLSALESGQLRLTRSRIDVHAIAESVVRELQVAAQAKGLRMSLRGKRALAFADPMRVRQILGNVVGNAVKFTHQGEVLVEVESASPTETTVIVSDTGPGIAEPDRAAIFEEYIQSAEQRRHRAGTGLGLAIARRLVQMHGGTIRLTSTVGKGSRFVMAFPTQPESNPDRLGNVGHSESEATGRYA